MLKSKKFWVIIAAFFVLTGGYYLFFASEKEFSYDFIVVKKGDVVQEVSVTGRVKPAESVNLAFEKAGKISVVYAEVGDRVFYGQILTQISSADILAQIQSAEANLKVQQAKLDELKVGTRPEEIRVYEVKVENAKIALDDTNQNLADKLQDAYTKSDDAVRGKVDQFFSNPRGSDPRLNFSIPDASLKKEIENERVSIESLLIGWEFSEAKQNLDEVKTFLDKAALAVNSLSSDYDSWKTDVSTARANINTAVVNLSTAEEEVRTAESALSLAEQNLDLKKAGSAVEQIVAQEAQVEKAEADIKKYQADIAKTIIRSPIDGIVTKQDAKIGEIISVNAIIISIISEVNFEIESDIPEVDIAKIELGDIAEVTLDAYGDDVFFSAVVAAIDPAETIIEGVPSYKTTLQFEKEDARIRSGMTANLDIITEKREGVIAVPQRAVISKNGQKFVRVIVEDGFEEKEVKTGLRGSFGNIEILEGIEQGDKVVTFMK